MKVIVNQRCITPFCHECTPNAHKWGEPHMYLFGVHFFWIITDHCGIYVMHCDYTIAYKCHMAHFETTFSTMESQRFQLEEPVKLLRGDKTGYSIRDNTPNCTCYACTLWKPLKCIRMQYFP